MIRGRLSPDPSQGRGVNTKASKAYKTNDKE